MRRLLAKIVPAPGRRSACEASPSKTAGQKSIVVWRAPFSPLRRLVAALNAEGGAAGGHGRDGQAATLRSTPAEPSKIALAT
jgi:hypothetical protein